MRIHGTHDVRGRVGGVAERAQCSPAARAPVRTRPAPGRARDDGARRRWCARSATTPCPGCGPPRRPSALRVSPTGRGEWWSGWSATRRSGRCASRAVRSPGRPDRWFASPARVTGSRHRLEPPHPWAAPAPSPPVRDPQEPPGARDHRRPRPSPPLRRVLRPRPGPHRPPAAAPARQLPGRVAAAAPRPRRRRAPRPAGRPCATDPPTDAPVDTRGAHSTDPGGAPPPSCAAPTRHGPRATS